MAVTWILLETAGYMGLFRGLRLLVQQFHSWDPMQQIQRSFPLKQQAEKPRLEQELVEPVFTTSTLRESSSSTSPDTSSTTAFTYLTSSWHKKDDVRNGEAVDSYQDEANLNGYHLKDVTDDVKDDDDNVRRSVKDVVREKSVESDVDTRSPPNSALRNSKIINSNEKQPQVNLGVGPKDVALPFGKAKSSESESEINNNIFTKDLSELSQEELIFRFVNNKEEFLDKSEKSLPMYLKPRNVHWTIQKAGEYSSSLYSPPPGELPEQRLPQAIIIGAGKCGTRALIEFMSMHPLVVNPDPEIHFFDTEENFAKGLDWYRSQMPLTYSNQMTIEKTPSYIWSSRALDEIYNVNKDIKLIAILRNPVERIVSQASRGDNDNVEKFFLGVENGEKRIKAEARTVDWGIYAKYLKAWILKYTSSQLHILEAKELIKDPALEMQKIEKFLGLPPMITSDNFYFNVTKGFYCMRPFHPKVIECLAEAKGKKHLTLSPVHDQMLHEFYRPYNEELFALLGRRFNWVPKR